MAKNCIITLLAFFTILCSTESCTSNNTQLVKLQQIDSLMEKNPQAAYDCLLHNQKKMLSDNGRKVAMLFKLLKAKAENKLYFQMPTDSMFKEVVDYYDNHGTSNKRMEARYLMGCIYRDQKEAPKAILWYNKAIECADTLSTDCDYITLYSIYGQIADIYSKQYLHQEAIKAEQKYINFAKKANKTESSIQGIGYIADEYYELGDTLKAMKLIKKCYLLFKKHHMYKQAAIQLPLLIRTHLYASQYKQAQHYMDIYEKGSGLFNKKGDIQAGYEHYYKFKGMYYLGINKIDSAEYYYRKLGDCGFNFEAAQGLLSVYREKTSTDSIKKYSILCEQEMDKILNGAQANAVIQAASLYNNTKLQKEIDEEKNRKDKNKYIAIIVCIISIFGLAYIRSHYTKIRKKLTLELSKVNNDYLQTIKKMEKAKEEINILQENSDLFIKKKQQEITLLQQALQTYKAEYDKYNLIDKKRALMESNIVQAYKNMAKPKKDRKSPTQEEWNELLSIFQQCLPLPYANISSNKLSTQEFQVSILTCLGMDNTEMSIILNSTSKAICNAKQKANKKMFNNNSASSLYTNLMKF